MRGSTASAAEGFRQVVSNEGKNDLYQSGLYLETLNLVKKYFMTKQNVIPLLIFLTVFASGCNNKITPTKVSYSVTGNADGAPIDCSPDQIASRISEAFNGINRADPDVVDKYFGRADYAPFGWYTIGVGEEQDAAYTWRTLDEYFQERFQQHEHIELRSIEFNGWDQEREMVHFGPIEIARTADDLGKAERIYIGKGAYYCKTRTIVVLSLGEYHLP